jgi:hypothetical protein
VPLAPAGPWGPVAPTGPSGPSFVQLITINVIANSKRDRSLNFLIVFVLGLIIDFGFKSKGIFCFSQRDLKIKEKKTIIDRF